jgi:hypothetical protein
LALNGFKIFSGFGGEILFSEVMAWDGVANVGSISMLAWFIGFPFTSLKWRDVRGGGLKGGEFRFKVPGCSASTA